jgi:hypothetical protein
MYTLLYLVCNKLLIGQLLERLLFSNTYSYQYLYCIVYGISILYGSKNITLFTFCFFYEKLYHIYWYFVHSLKTIIKTIILKEVKICF